MKRTHNAPNEAHSRNSRNRIIPWFIAAGLLGAFIATPSQALAVDNGAENVIAIDEAEGNTAYTGWASDESGELYWFDYGTMAKNKEAYDPETDAWYWFDSDGTMAFSKDVWIPNQDKWVRYDENGHMIKGVDDRYGGRYFFDPITGEMKHGEAYLDLGLGDGSNWYNFDVITGKMDRDKDVFLRSNGGKWVRYNEKGIMVKGENYARSKDDGNWHWWYFDPITGEMAKGLTTIPANTESGSKTVYYDPIMGWMLYGTQTVNGTTMHFDEVTGALSTSPAYTGDATRDEIISIAMSKLGAPYKHAGLGPDAFSCDGFTAWVYDQAGVKVYESRVDSSFNGQSAYLRSIGKLVTNVNDLKPGDIVFFGSSWNSMRHAAIYLGNDQLIHAIDAAHGVGITNLSAEINAFHDFLGGGSPLD